MKKHYDKLFLLVAVLVAAVSAYYFVSAKGGIEESASKFRHTLKKQFGGEKWAEVKVEPLELKTSTWEQVLPQDEEGLWLYQLFTSPKIWVDEDGNFIAEPVLEFKKGESQYGLKYVGVENLPYPIQFKGYFIDPEGEVVVQLSDEERGVALKGKIDDEIMYRRKDGKQVKAGIVVKKFERKTVRQKDGTIKQAIFVTLFDEKLGREVLIEYGKPTIIDENRTMVLATASGSGQWNIKKVGDTFADGETTYTVKELDFDGDSVVVEKVTPRKNNPNPNVQLIKFSKDQSPTIIKK